MDSHASKDVCFEIENDEFFRQFLTSSDASKQRRQQQQESMSAAEKIRRLNEGVARLSGELEAQVVARHGELLARATRSAELEAAIARARADSNRLLGGIDGVRARVAPPRAELERARAAALRVEDALHATRQCARILRLHDKMRALARDGEESPALAKCVRSIEEAAAKVPDLDKVELVAEEIRETRAKKEEIVAGASRGLHEALANGDRAALSKALEVFANLKCAKEKIDEVVSTELGALARHCRTTCDAARSEPKKSTDVVRTGPGRANATDAIDAKLFWENVERLFAERVYSACKKIILLQNSLDDLRSFENYRHVASAFWDDLSAALAAEFKKSSLAINRIVENDFPRLLECHNDLCRRLHYERFHLKREALSTWENAFLSKSLAKLLDCVRGAWPSSRAPGVERVDEAVRAIAAALSFSSSDDRLGASLALSVAKCVKQMCAEAEQRVRVDDDAGQVVGPPTSSQQINAELANALHRFARQIDRALSNMRAILSAESVDIVKDSLKDASCASALAPLRLSMNDAIDSILASMHDEIGRAKIENENACSLYMKELQRFAARCNETYLSAYEDASSIRKCREEIVERSVQTFLYNVCSIGPIPSEWRARLQNDCSRLVDVLTEFESTSGASCRPLRALHNLLRSPQEHASDRSLSHSLRMMVLFVFAGGDLLPPHLCANWTRQNLVEWLRQHNGERERVEFVAGALQRYAQFVNQNKLTKYDDVYPMLVQLLEDARKSY